MRTSGPPWPTAPFCHEFHLALTRAASERVKAPQGKDRSMGDMEAIVIEFVEEGNERADQLERQLILLEKSPVHRIHWTKFFAPCIALKERPASSVSPNSAHLRTRAKAYWLVCAMAP